VIIGLELLDIVYALLNESRLQVETVLLVVVTAVARELIVFDYEHADGVVLASVGVVVAAVAIAYYLIKNGPRPHNRRRYHLGRAITVVLPRAPAPGPTARRSAPGPGLPPAGPCTAIAPGPRLAPGRAS